MAKVKDLKKLSDTELEAYGLELDKQRLAIRDEMIALQKAMVARVVTEESAGTKSLELDAQRVAIHKAMLDCQHEYDTRVAVKPVSGETAHTISGAGNIQTGEAVGKVGGK